MIRMAVFILCVAMLSGCGSHGPGGTTGGLTPEQHRELATRLQAAGVVGQAAVEYGVWMDGGGPQTPEEKANAAFTVGKMLVEAGRYEEALGWLYRVEILHPETALKGEAGSRIVTCLEKLGRHQEASRALSDRTAREGGSGKTAKEGKGGAVLARIGSEEITQGEVDALLDSLPPDMGRRLQDPRQKNAFILQFVAERALVQKAQREGMDQRPEILQQLENMRRTALVSALVSQKLAEAPPPDPEDIRNYFQAHASRYSTDGKQAEFDQVVERVGMDYAQEKQQRMVMQMFEEVMSGGEVTLVDPTLAGMRAPPAPPSSPEARSPSP